MTQGDRRWEEMSDAEFLADYEAKHGRKAAEQVARALAMDPPPKRPRRAGPSSSNRVGAKEVKRRGLGQNLIPARGPTMKEMSDAGRDGDLPPERARILSAGFAGSCKAAGCGLPFAKGDEVVMLEPSHRVVHGRCAHAAARERCQPSQGRQ